MNLVVLLLWIFQTISHILGIVPKSGPYLSVPIGNQECKDPPKPYEDVRSMEVHSEFYNTSAGIYNRGNLSVYVNKKWSSIQIRGRVYIQEDDQWRIVKIMNSDGCRGFLVTTFFRMMRIKYDTKGCSIPVGVYSFDNLDLNKVEHVLWPSYREYGRYLWVFDAQSRGATLICQNYETWVIPLKTTSLKKTTIKA